VTGQIDALVSATATGLRLAQEKRGRNLLPASDIVTNFMIHAIYASNKMVAERPEVIRRFLAAWFETIAFMYGAEAGNRARVAYRHQLPARHRGAGIRHRDADVLARTAASIRARSRCCSAPSSICICSTRSRI